MDEKDIALFSNRVLISENENGDLVAKFAVCGFETNLNGVRLNRDTIENWMSSLITSPLCGRINKARTDFEGHNLVRSYMRDSEGNFVPIVEFLTEALGVFTDVGIETIDDVEVIVGTVTVWSRFPRACKIIKDRAEAGVLRTSWEITPIQVHYDDDGVKVIDSGIFKGLCLLGAKVDPAYPDTSYMMEIAEESIDEELLEAMMHDIMESEKRKENEMARPKKIEEPVVEEPVVASGEEVIEEPVVEEPVVVSAEEPVVDNAASVEGAENVVDEVVAEVVEQEPETSSLTEWDLRKRISEACRAKVDKWCWVSFWFPNENYVWCEVEGRESELDYVMFTYTVTETDEVIVDEGIPVKLTVSVAQVNDTIAQKDQTIADATVQIAELEKKLNILDEFKTKYEQAEAERLEAEKKAQREELSAYAIKSGLISEEDLQTEEIAQMISDVDKAAINQLIASRFMEKRDMVGKDEISKAVEPEISANLTAEDVKPARQSIIQAYLAL